MGYVREFWRDNKKSVGSVCEECRAELDGRKALRGNAAKCCEIAKR